MRRYWLPVLFITMTTTAGCALDEVDGPPQVETTAAASYPNDCDSDDMSAAGGCLWRTLRGNTLAQEFCSTCAYWNGQAHVTTAPTASGSWQFQGVPATGRYAFYVGLPNGNARAKAKVFYSVTCGSLWTHRQVTQSDYLNSWVKIGALDLSAGTPCTISANRSDTGTQRFVFDNARWRRE